MVRFLPAQVDSGIFFVRTDLAQQPKIPARVENRIDKPRQTSLERGGARVDMVEHLLAAVRGLEIDNLEIQFSSAEAPGFDGSALPFVQTLLEAGIAEQDSLKKIRVVRKSYRFGDQEKGIEILPVSGETSRYRYAIDYSVNPNIVTGIPHQSFNAPLLPEQFSKEIAPARTFLLQSEAVALRKMGLCQRVSYQDVLVFGADGVIDNTLRFENECARHKVLDMIGDFSLASTPIIAEFRGSRTGHAENAQVLKSLLEEIPPEEISEDGFVKVE